MNPAVHSIRRHDPEYAVDYLHADDILAHPEFPEARRVYLGSILALYGGSPFLNKLLLDAARQVVLGGCICLYAAWEAGDRASWPTLANLKRTLRPFGQGSDRRIEQLVSRLVSVGYLSQQGAQGDARVKLLVPSEKMLHHDQDWLLAHYRPLAALYPDAEYALPLARDTTFQLMQRRVSFGFIPRSAQVLLSNPAILPFAIRDVGFLVLARLAMDMEEGCSSSSYDALADKFGISRTHVRDLIQDVQAMGLMRVSGRGGQRVELMPAMWNALDRFIAEGMSGHDLTAAVARQRLAGVRQ